ncbi:MAG: alpha/beta hydrolase [Thermocrispum sp.]
MTTASPRAADAGRQDSPIRTGHRKYAGVRTRVLKVEQPARRAGGVRYVMFHGYCDSADTWRRVLLEFAASGDQAVAIDLPGFGEAEGLRPGPILPQLDAFVRAVVQDQAKHGDVVLVGNSLGGTMSLRAAQHTKLPVAGVVSIAAPGLADTWLVNTVKRYPLPLRLYGSLPLPIPRRLVRGVADAVVPRLLYASPRARDDEDARRFIELFPSNRSVRERLTQARQLTSEFDETLYELDRITSPLLVLTCGKDRLVRADSGQMLHSLVPHSRLVVHEDWGHCPQLDHATEIHQLVRYFAQSSQRASARSVTRRAPRQHRTRTQRAEAG